MGLGPPPFEIHERREDGRIRVKLTGQLDLATAHLLEGRLRELHAQQLAVRLDLSELEFMDSAGLHVLIHATDPREDGWRLELEPDVSPQVRRLFQLVGLESRFLGSRQQPLLSSPPFTA